MAALPDLEEWIADSNEALNISLVAPTSSGLQLISTFNPTFTYPFFGEDEKIFGYKDLKISLRYRANDMRPHLRTSYSSKFTPIGETEPMDVKQILKEDALLPDIAFGKAADFESNSQKLGDDWTPPGDLHASFEGTDGRYEIWKGTLADPAIKQLNNRIQLLIPLFIEGGSFINSTPGSDSSETGLPDADRWTLFLLYRKQSSYAGSEKNSYVFVGYSTVYRFFYFQPPPTPPATPNHDWELPKGNLDLAQLPCRTRLSQFLILPPFQGHGHGARLYKSIFEHYHKHPQTREFTVENPNEAFDELRDACDLKYLRTVPEFAALKLNPSVTVGEKGLIPQLIKGGENLEAIRTKTKIAPRQFARVLEMHVMSQLPDSVRPRIDPDETAPAKTAADRHLERLWQLLVKQRLYRHNRDVLAQFDLPERIEKLGETLLGVELEYARLLAAHGSNFANAKNVKRRLDDDAKSTSSKRTRIDEE
ncbi:Histone acetyltransferase type B, catalytic subunit [Cordyceps fumosorosea ARSEF 2679]|uniref:Histone acetyltransferase type B catalytic subunit n=1 Tax=Cordyceps fumosorosea (strain ARSEF 2679) TaxID=1081104 RepID=A0A168B0G4_CORFA|nr:Histone acetyltransferase type B, catalytic subunit [Cordyceps fumosorosea ARSEF 2679]OAA69445.1 Histone acetyltransferase type B, catalytic subunit [Cordyceps fumosorosea ARSEF 2679]